MTAEEFVKAVDKVVRLGAVQALMTALEKPPGRRPQPALVAQSEWFRSLAPNERELLKGVLDDAVDHAIFGFFCVLDGVRAVENGPNKGDFILSYVKGTSTPLNGPDLPMLHDLYAAR